MNISIKGKKILVVGGAGKLGQSISTNIANSGAIPIIADANEENLENLKFQLKSKKYYAFKSKIENFLTIEECFSKSIKLVGELDGIVYASYPKSKGWGSKIEDLNEDNLREDLFMQLGLPILFSRHAIDYFLKKGSGNLIHISSIQGVRAPKFEHYIETEMTSPIEYSAIKSGIISMSKWLAKYYKYKNIRINCISPGGIKDDQPKIFQEKYKKDCTNLGLLDSNHISSLVVYLLSDSSIAINGQNLIVDDGWSL